MNTSGSSASHTPAHSRTLGVSLIFVALLSFAPVAILGPDIGWPASLRNPAAQQLSAIAANADAVAWGYGVYLLYSVLIAPVMVMLVGRVFGGFHRPVAVCVAVFAGLSALARCIGISRWLTVMPELAQAHAKADGAADPAGRAMLEMVFNAVHSYGGGIGEILGVGLFMGLAVGSLSVAAWREGGMPKWLAGLGLVSAALLASMLLPSLNVAVKVPVAIVVTVLTVWMAAAGVWTLRKPS